MIQLRLPDIFQIEVDSGLVGEALPLLVRGVLGLREAGLELLVRYEIDHRVGNVPDAAETAGFPGQGVGGDIHTHAADHDRHQFKVTQGQAIVVDSRHGALPPSVSGTERTNWNRRTYSVTHNRHERPKVNDSG